MASTRITIATISTKDEKLVKMSEKAREQGVTHEDIYRRGLVEILKAEADK